MTRVAVAAGAPLVRAGLEALIASTPGMELVGAFADAASAEGVAADVLVAAARWEDLPASLDGRPLAVVLLAAGTPPPFTREALASGVRAILSRDSPAREILAAIEAAAAGLAVVDPRELEPLVAVSIAAPASDDGEPLTAREREVLRMMAEGDANKAIAWKLAISEHTVKFHVASILAKLGAATRTEAATIGIRKGLVLL